MKTNKKLSAWLSIFGFLVAVVMAFAFTGRESGAKEQKATGLIWIKYDCSTGLVQPAPGGNTSVDLSEPLFDPCVTQVSTNICAIQYREQDVQPTDENGNFEPLPNVTPQDYRYCQ